jgi:PGF-pre-PGF domain-containing protein
MRDIELRNVLCVLVVVLCLMPMGAMATLNCNSPVIAYNELDLALKNQTDGAACTLTSDINSTFTEGNYTDFWRSITITSAGFKIFVNNTILFNGTSGQRVTFGDRANFTYDPAALSSAKFNNASLFQFVGSGGVVVTPNAAGLTLDAGAFTGDPVNITGNNNVINAGLTILGTPTRAINISGSNNTVDLSTGSITATERGINLSGSSNTLTVRSRNGILGALSYGKIHLATGATKNIISDTDFAANLPTVYIYNGTTSHKTTSAWYFYNTSWSKSGKNMNVTINVSNSIPLAGNVNIVVNWSNVTYPNVYNVYVNKTTGDSAFISNGYTGGWSLNTTEGRIFSGNFPAMVPVNISFGNNFFGGEYQTRTIGTVYFLNFNPVNSTTPGTGQYFNVTGTTNWTTIPDFTNAQNVTFVVDSGYPSYTLYGNLSFLDPLDLTSPSTGAVLSRLGTALSMSTTGNSIKMDVASGTGIPALDQAAVLKVYPTNFVVTAGSTNIKVMADSTQIYNKGSWNKAGYVSDSADLTVGDGWITLPVLHFTTYDFSQGVNPAPPVSVPAGDSEGGAPAAPAAPAVAVGESKTVSVNVGGASAISRVAVTGTGINDVIVTALTRTDLPASITPPATTVYQYMTVSPARYTTISSVMFNFNIPASWLAEKGYTKNDIVMTLWDPDAKTWISLPTSIISENQGVITYQAIAPHMSEYAIVYQKGASAQAQANVTAIQTSVPLKTTTTYMTTTQSIRPTTPTPTQTAAPAASTPPTGGTPVTTIVIAVVGIVVIVVGAFLVHRWWIRKQNPELFKELK